jgi:uncharacterized protein (TIGR02268 family)
MDLLLPTALLTLVLSAGVTEPPPPDCEAPRSLLELGQESTGSPPVVCITPGLVTALLFGSPIIPSSVVLRGEEHFEPAEPGSHHLLLLPRNTLLPGTRLELELRFEDGASPSQVTLTLLVHPARLLRQVRVERRVHSVEFYQRREEQARAEAQRYQEALVRVRAEPQVVQGLRGLLHTGLMVAHNGVEAHRLSRHGWHAAPGLRLEDAWAYQAVGRVALDVVLANRSPRSWQVAGVSLTGPQGEVLELLPLGPLDALVPGQESRHVQLEAEAPVEGVEGPYTLVLWSADDLRTLTVEEIFFP